MPTPTAPLSEAVPRPRTVTDVHGNPCTAATPASYPLHALCDHCGGDVRCADGTATWYHPSTGRAQCEPLTIEQRLDHARLRLADRAKLDPQVKASWLEALRGDYRQAQSVLRDGDAYCCLGVLCDLHRQAEAGEWEWVSPQPQVISWLYVTGKRERRESSTSIPPWSVREWAGLDAEVIPILAILNDFEATFAQIADVIEECL